MIAKINSVLLPLNAALGIFLVIIIVLKSLGAI